MKIKYCPFCGSATISIQRHPDLCFLLCEDCGAGGPVEDTQEEAFESWNERYNKVGWVEKEMLGDKQKGAK